MRLPLTSLISRLLIALIITCTYGQTYAFDESTISGLIETYSKELVIGVITEKRHGKITIARNKTFRDARGRPEARLITPMTIREDLKITGMSVADFETELKAAKAAREKRDSDLTVSNTDEQPITPPLSAQLEAKLKHKKKMLSQATTAYEKRRLKQEVRTLDRKLKRARYDEKYNPTKKKSANNSYQRNRYSQSSCESAKSSLAQATDPTYRHKVFFCKDRKYRAENPKSCKASSSGGRYGYSRTSDLKQYKEKVSKLRANVARYCK